MWLLELEGRVAGSGGLEMYEQMAVLIAGCVDGEARGKGLQSAFIRFRLQEAVSAGLAYATVGSTPGGPTERNAQRAGFAGCFTLFGLEQR